MQRLALGLALMLLCGAVSAEQIKPAKVTAAPPTKTVPANTAAAAKTAPAKKPPAPPAKMLFGAVMGPAPLAARAIGSYARGCLAGGISLPINGPDWQVMRLSRNRNWGHPRLLDYLERLASDARALDGWPGLLVGDMAQPRGGPMITGHASHQIGLDADIWFTPMPNRILTPQEREDLSATSMLKDPFTVDPAIWTPLHTKLVKRAASYPQVSRIFVHPAIKKILCEQAGKDRAWLGKVRPWWGHYYHFHIRLSCPPGMEGCDNQKPVTGDDGCGAELANWFKMLRKAEIDAARAPATGAPGAPTAHGKPPLSLGDLPRECMTVLDAGGGAPTIAPDGTVPAALKMLAGKDAGPPAPHLDPAALAALKAQMAPSKPGAKPVPDAAAKPTAEAVAVKPDAATVAPSADADAKPATASAGAPTVPLPDRKPAH
jgi:penicillin-insensitive murein DD-endopeptidase